MTETTTTEDTYVLTLEEEVAQFVKEHNADGIVARLVKLEERCIELAQSKDNIMTRLQDERQTVREMRDTVGNKFREMLDGDKDATIEMDLDDINELLTDIGASKIVFTWSVDVTVTATLTGIEADSEEEAKEKAIAALSLNVDTNSLGENGDSEDEEYEADNAQEEDN
jgi:hypothetical protein